MGKVSVTVSGSRLYLLSVFPDKKGSRAPYKQKLPLYLDDTAASRKVAEKRRSVCQAEIDGGTFCWEDWLKEATKPPTWQDGIDALYRKRCVIGTTGQETWRINYMGRLKQLPAKELITEKSVLKALMKYDRAQCSYKELFYLLKDMCALVKVPFPEAPKPTYNSKIIITEVPEEHEVIDWITRADPEASWYFGMMATFGLRDHEIDGIKFLDDETIHVPEFAPTGQRTKTGERMVLTPRPEWVEQFDLRNERRFTYKSTQVARCCQRLHYHKKKIGIKYKAYALRHFYAAMLWEYGGSELDIYTAARYMGHTVKEHEETYRAHIAPHTVITRGKEIFRKARAERRARLEAGLKSTKGSQR